MKINLLFLFLVCSPFASLEAISLSEKKAKLSSKEHREGSQDFNTLLKQHNQEITEQQEKISQMHKQAFTAYEKLVQDQAKEDTLNAFLKEERELLTKEKKELLLLQDNWKELSKQGIEIPSEGLWHQPDTTVGQLVIDYGSYDFVYLVPPDIAGYKIHVSSQLSIPKAAWGTMLEQILYSYGIGVREINPFVKVLFLLKVSPPAPDHITSNIEELHLLPANKRISLILSPPPSDAKRIFSFLEKCISQEQMSATLISNFILLTGQVRELLEISKVYTFLSSNELTQEHRFIPLQKTKSEEAAKILNSLFNSSDAQSSGGSEKQLPFLGGEAPPSLRIIPLQHPSQALFLIGSKSILEKASQMLADLEAQIDAAKEKTVYIYACRHSTSVDLAKMLSQVYGKMISTPQAFGQQNIPTPLPDDKENPTEKTTSKEGISDNFIVDNKTNSIIMVIETALLDKMKSLIKVLDIPKKMVQLDVLLFEKKVKDANTFGLNLLRLGDAATGKNTTKLHWNDGSKKGPGLGILNFAFSQAKSGDFPSYDFAYTFLLSQDDIQVNANPSVTTVNQTAAKISIVDEISISTGTYTETAKDEKRPPLDAFTRSEYGITLNITPTVHSEGVNENETSDPKFITIAADLSFESSSDPKGNDRPDITKRNVKNEVRIADGETLVLGGLRSKKSSSGQQSIPFLGEIPGIGKFFSYTTLVDESTEMFIFITPHIISDDRDTFHKTRLEELQKRPGDIPEFLEEVEISKNKEKKMIFSRTFRALFGAADIRNPKKE